VLTSPPPKKRVSQKTPAKTAEQNIKQIKRKKFLPKKIKNVKTRAQNQARHKHEYFAKIREFREKKISRKKNNRTQPSVCSF